MRKDEFPIVEEYCRDKIIEELEKIRKEVGIKATMHQDGDIYIRHFEVAKIIDNHIKELKEK